MCISVCQWKWIWGTYVWTILFSRHFLATRKKKKKRKRKKTTFQKEYDLADEYFFDNSKKDISFTQNASTNELCYYVSFKKNLSLAQINKNLQKQYELAAEVCPDFQHRIFPESKFLKIWLRTDSSLYQRL